MKRVNLLNTSILVVLVAFVAVGCKKNPGYTTTLPGQNPRVGGAGDNSGLAESPKVKAANYGANESIPATDQPDLSKYDRNNDILKGNTVYFDYDKSAIKS